MVFFTLSAKKSLGLPKARLKRLSNLVSALVIGCLLVSGYFLRLWLRVAPPVARKSYPPPAAVSTAYQITPLPGEQGSSLDRLLSGWPLSRLHRGEEVQHGAIEQVRLLQVNGVATLGQHRQASYPAWLSALV